MFDFLTANEDPLTSGGLDQHIAKTRKRNNGGKAPKAPTKTLTALPKHKAAPSTAAAPVTPMKSKSPKTPTTSGKRKRGTMSDDDESDVDEEGDDQLSKAKLTEGLGRRSSIPRSLNKGKQYKEESSDDEDEAEAEVEQEPEPESEHKLSNANSGMATLGIPDAPEDDFFNFDGVAENERSHLTGATPSKRRRVRDDSDAESDISNFSATFS